MYIRVEFKALVFPPLFQSFINAFFSLSHKGRLEVFRGLML